MTQGRGDCSSVVCIATPETFDLKLTFDRRLEPLHHSVRADIAAGKASSGLWECRTPGRIVSPRCCLSLRAGRVCKGGIFVRVAGSPGRKVRPGAYRKYRFMTKQSSQSKTARKRQLFRKLGWIITRRAVTHRPSPHVPHCCDSLMRI